MGEPPSGGAEGGVNGRLPLSAPPFREDRATRITQHGCREGDSHFIVVIVDDGVSGSLDGKKFMNDSDGGCACGKE